MHIVDWLVLAGNAGLMLGVGAFYSRQNKSGGRLPAGRTKNVAAARIAIGNEYSFAAWPDELKT